MPSLERRYTRHADRPMVLARDGGKPPVIAGYAAVFYDPADAGTEYQIYDDLVERIMPGAFDRALREDDVRGLYNHDDNLPLGRTGAGTMRLSVDDRGLRYEIDPPDTQAARDLLVSLGRGDVTGSSFSFLPRDTTTRRVEKLYVLERNDVRLFDVGPVVFPAYAGTEAGVRSAAGHSEAARREVERYEHLRQVVRTALRARARAITTQLAD